MPVLITTTEYLRRNNRDTTPLLRDIVRFAEARKAYNTAYVASVLLGDELNQKRFLKLESEVGSDCEGPSSESISLYDYEHGSIFIHNIEWMKILLQNDFYRTKFKSLLDKSKKNIFNAESYFILGERDGLNECLKGAEQDFLDQLEYSSRMTDKAKSQGELDFVLDNFEEIIDGAYRLAKDLYDGYKMLQQLPA